MLTQKIIGFIGAGSLSQSMLKGLIQSQTVRAANVLVTNRSDSRKLDKLAEMWNIEPSTKDEILQRAEIIVLAAKPKDIAGVMEEIGKGISAKQVLISVAAAIPTSFIEGYCEAQVPVVRAMPNTSCTVLESMTAVCLGKYADSKASDIAAKLFSAIGKVEIVAEAELDAITGMSGSGPAYFYHMVEAMELAGERLGLSREISVRLVVQTILGAAKMLVETGEKPGDLRAAVTSKGGTTFAGLQALEANNFTESIYLAVKAATERSREMRQEFTGV